MSVPVPLASASLSRRTLLGMSGAAAGLGSAAALAVRFGATASMGALLSPRAAASEIGPLLGAERVRAAYLLRVAAARAQGQLPLGDHPDNGDEALYPDKRGSYSKALATGPWDSDYHAFVLTSNRQVMDRTAPFHFFHYDSVVTR